MKENKKRITFYGIIFVIFLILSIYGLNLYNKGYGKYGQIKLKLDPIALEFNTLQDVRNLTDITASVKKDQLIVTYINVSNKKEKYIYQYTENNGIEYITNTDEYNSNTWNFIAIQMINAVYHANGGKGNVFELYDMKTFESTTLIEGLTLSTTKKTVSINIKANIVKNISGKYPSIKDEKYIKAEDLVALKDTLATDGKMQIKVDDVNVYVKQNDEGYEIYSTVVNDNRQRVYKSIGNIIQLLKPSLYELLLGADNEIHFETESTEYQYLETITFSESGIFETNNEVFEITFKK